MGWKAGGLLFSFAFLGGYHAVPDPTDAAGQREDTQTVALRGASTEEPAQPEPIRAPASIAIPAAPDEAAMLAQIPTSVLRNLAISLLTEASLKVKAYKRASGAPIGDAQPFGRGPLRETLLAHGGDLSADGELRLPGASASGTSFLVRLRTKVLPGGKIHCEVSIHGVIPGTRSYIVGKRHCDGSFDASAGALRVSITGESIIIESGVPFLIGSLAIPLPANGNSELRLLNVDTNAWETGQITWRQPPREQL